jgi:hypothetical protein
MMIAQRLQESYEVKLVSFQKYVLKLRKQHEYQSGQTGNVDQTLVFCDVLKSVTVNSAGK